MKWLLALVVLLLALLPGCAAEEPTIFLWHSYLGDEAHAVDALADLYRTTHPDAPRVETLGVPHGAYASKLEAAIPHGHGPDVFIDAHERLGSFERNGLVADVGDALDPNAFDRVVVDSVSLGRPYGVPLAIKCLALIVNARLVPQSPPSLDALVRTPMAPGVYPLAYNAASSYLHAPILHAMGGKMLDDDGSFGMHGPEAEASLALVAEWTKKGYLPAEANDALVDQLFRAERAAAVISGPWFLADFGFPIRVEPLPVLEATHAPARPFLTIEAAMLTPAGAARPEVRAFARWLATNPQALEVRARIGKQVVAAKSGASSESAETAAFRAAAANAITLPTSPAMRATWEPAEQALRRVIRGETNPHDALTESARRFADAVRPPPPPPSKTPLVLVTGVLLLGAALLAVRRAREPTFRRELRASLPAYAYITHAVIIVTLLIVLPLLAGTLTSLFAGRWNDPQYVGLANYVSILTARGGALLGHGSFYLTLLVTILWTLVNVTLHVVIGVTLALLLSREALRVRPLYRSLLVLPWAIPSYVTALAWKGMFHRQFGAINAILGLFHVEPISWFSRFSTAFAANVSTNVWLGFPFMMVVTLGALTSIPKDVLEAAEIDGATPAQAFWRVTLPLLRPSLLPAVALGAIWTFNMFNVVFLVSEGEPDGSTDILVSDAYRWAFTREAQLGYAAAYSVVIMLILFGATRLLEGLRTWSGRPAKTKQPLVPPSEGLRS